MKVRQAEPRDVSSIERLFHELLECLQGLGQKWYKQDKAELRNGVAGFIIGKMFQEDGLVLVSEDKNGEVEGFLIGGIVHYSKIFEHEILGEIQWLYPISLKELPTFSRKMANIFEVWARTKGATAGSNYCLPGNEQAQRLMEHDGREKVFYYYIKPYLPVGGQK